jgi:hypothetical protein
VFDWEKKKLCAILLLVIFLVVDSIIDVGRKKEKE